MEKDKKTRTAADTVRTVVMIVLTVILVPVLAVNLTLIIKGSLHEDVPPDIFGIAPLAVTSGSMDGDRDGSFAKGALIFVRILDEEGKNALQTGDVITFRSGNAYVTHRITATDVADGVLLHASTQGDANDYGDGAIPAANIVGKCVGSVAGLGGFSMFLQTTEGILVFVGVPVLAFIAFDIVRITLQNRRARAAAASSAALETKDEQLRDKDAEIARLRAMVAAQQGAAPADGESANGETANAESVNGEAANAETGGQDGSQ